MQNIEIVKIEDILFIEDRNEGKQGNIKALANSIQMIGLLNPILIRKTESEEKPYKIIAGRRRLKAVELLGESEIASIIYDENADISEQATDEFIALTENTYRLNLHPLDEGAQLKKLLDNGFSMEELQSVFDKSKAYIYQRLKLNSLIDEFKIVFKENKIKIYEAAKIASLSKENQKEIYNKCKQGSDFSSFSVSYELRSTLKQPLCFNCSKCKSCKKRTNFSDNLLFPELKNETDYCFDFNCYKSKYRASLEDEFYKASKIKLEVRTKDENISFENFKTYFFNSDFFENNPEELEQFTKNVNKTLNKIGNDKFIFYILNKKVYSSWQTKSFFEDGVLRLSDIDEISPVMDEHSNFRCFCLSSKLQEKIENYEAKPEIESAHQKILDKLPEEIKEKELEDYNSYYFLDSEKRDSIAFSLAKQYKRINFEFGEKLLTKIIKEEFLSSHNNYDMKIFNFIFSHVMKDYFKLPKGGFDGSDDSLHTLESALKNLDIEDRIFEVLGLSLCLHSICNELNNFDIEKNCENLSKIIERPLDTAKKYYINACVKCIKNKYKKEKIEDETQNAPDSENNIHEPIPSKEGKSTQESPEVEELEELESVEEETDPFRKEGRRELVFIEEQIIIEE